MAKCMLSILIQREGKTVAFYHGRDAIRENGLRQIKNHGLSFGGSFHHSKVNSLRNNHNVEVVSEGEGWTAFRLKDKHRKPMTYFLVNDNRGKNPNMLPHEAFSVVKMIGKQSIWEEHHYSQDEAQRAAELHISQKS